MKRLLWLLPLLFVAVTSAAPSIPQQGATALSAFLKSATDRGDVPGVVVAVVNKDGMLYNEAFGVSSTLTKRPMTKDTIFNMASMTKPVTSVAIMMLVDEGKLKLDDEVAKYLPKYKDPLVISKFNEADASLRDAPGKAADHHPPSADPHVRHRIRVREPDADEDHAEDQARPSWIFRSCSTRARAGPMAPARACSATSSR